MARFQHRENKRIAELLKVNEKFKTVTVRFEDTGKEMDYSNSTWKRYWKQIEDEDTTAVVMEQKKDLGIEVASIDPTQVEVVEETCGDGTPYTQVMKEIIQDEKKAVEKKAKKSKEKKARTDKPKKEVFDSTALQEYAISVVEQLGGDYKQRKMAGGSKDMPVKVFRADGHMFMHMHYSKYQVFMDTRGVDTEKFPPDAIVTTGFYDSRYFFTEDNKQVRSKVKQILTQAYKSQLTKKAKKEDKK